MDENKTVLKNIEAEQALLGSMLIDARCISDIMSVLQPKDL